MGKDHGASHGGEEDLHGEGVSEDELGFTCEWGKDGQAHANMKRSWEYGFQNHLH